MSSKDKSPQVITPTPPPAPPSYGQQITDYLTNLPRLIQSQKDYDPQLAQLEYDLYEDFAPQYTKLAYDLEKSLYPETAGLQENLARQAREGMDTPLPEWAKQQYESDFNAGIGANVNAPIGVSDRSIGVLNLEKQWGDYYRNLGLSVAQRQPLQTTANPTFQNRSTNELQNQAAYNAQTYGSYANAFAGQNVIAQPRTSPFSGTGALTGALVGAPFGPIGIAGGAILGGFGR